MPKQRQAKPSKASKARKGPIGAVTSVAAAYSVKSGMTQPKITSTAGNGSIRIKRTEFVGSATNGSTTGYSLIGLSSFTPGYDLNPGCGTLFPWLSTVASSFERFRFHSLSFRLIPSQSTATAGRVYAAVDYDWDDPPAGSKLSLMSNRSVQEGSVWNVLELRLDSTALHPDMQEKYVSIASRNNFIEPRTCYCGFLQIGVDTPTANLLFDLEVSYDVSLSLPVFEPHQPIDSLPTTATAITPVIATALAAGLSCRVLTEDVTVPPGYNSVQIVPVGQSGHPQMLFNGSATYPIPPGTKVADVGDLASKTGALGFTGLLTAAGISPRTLTDTNEGKLGVYFHDALGAYLGYLTGVAGSTQVVDPGSGAAQTTLGSPVSWAVKVALRSVFAAFPTLRYIVPVFISNAGIATAGTARAGVRLEL